MAARGWERKIKPLSAAIVMRDRGEGKLERIGCGSAMKKE
jgi:hypothetical protein